VARVELHFDPPLSVERAQQLADSPIDVRVVWAGFALGTGVQTGLGLDEGGTVGYGTCDVREGDPDMLRASSAGYGRSSFSLEPSIARALDATRASVENLVGHDDIIGGLRPFATAESVVAARNYLADHAEVRTLVATGPTPELLQFIVEADPAAVFVHGIDFTNWYQPLCGK
jgi:hypothetical protein